MFLVLRFGRGTAASWIGSTSIAAGQGGRLMSSHIEYSLSSVANSQREEIRGRTRLGETGALILLRNKMYLASGLEGMVEW